MQYLLSYFSRKFNFKSNESYFRNIFSYFGMPGSLYFLIKTNRHKYRKYHLPLRKGNTVSVINRNRPELYKLYTITVCTHTTNYQ